MENNYHNKSKNWWTTKKSPHRLWKLNKGVFPSKNITESESENWKVMENNSTNSDEKTDISNEI